MAREAGSYIGVFARCQVRVRIVARDAVEFAATLDEALACFQTISLKTVGRAYVDIGERDIYRGHVALAADGVHLLADQQSQLLHLEVLGASRSGRGYVRRAATMAPFARYSG